jgi:hypothetical protein
MHMPRFSEPRRVPIDSLKIDPAIAPKPDETLIRLVGLAVKGHMPVYLAQIPLAPCVPFDLDYGPEVHPAIAKLTQDRIEKLQQQPISMIVYPRGHWFIVSDDYPTLFAYRERLPSHAPCIVIGKPEGEHVEVLEGPLTPEEAKEAIFGGMVTG